jgi:hypothetical protein
VPKTSIYLSDSQSRFLKATGLSASELLQEAIENLQLAPLEEKFREELEKYRNDSARRAEWYEKYDQEYPFKPCPVCGTGMDDAEGCLAMFEPYEAAPVALLAHYPDDMRRANLRYWEKSGFKDIPLGIPE